MSPSLSGFDEKKGLMQAFHQTRVHMRRGRDIKGAAHSSFRAHAGISGTLSAEALTSASEGTESCQTEKTIGSNFHIEFHRK